MENAYVRNNLICSYASGNMEKISEIYTHKFKQILPNSFPRRRLEYLSQKILAPSKTDPVLSCDWDEKRNYERSLFYELRAQAYPVFPDSLSILESIAINQRKESKLLNQLEKFKKIILQEKESFDSFRQDCALIIDMAEQIKLLEKHLKIEQQSREPSQVKKTLTRIHKSILRQLEFAKKHLQSNEKMFINKWKPFFDFESEKILCPR